MANGYPANTARRADALTTVLGPMADLGLAAQGQSSGKPIAGHWIPRIKCLSCSCPDCFLILLILAMDTTAGDIRAVEFTSSDKGDSALLPDLLAQIPDAEGIESVTADGAHDTCRCLEAILARGAEPTIPVRRNGRMWKPGCPAAIWRNETLRATQRLGRGLWKKWSGYHVRSRIEAQMNCLKLFGDRIVSRDPDRQVAEIHIRIAIMNRCSAMGMAEIERVK